MALTKVEPGGVDLTDTFAFTGTVSGTGFDLLATIDASPSASTYEWSMNYTDYTDFQLIVERISGSSTRRLLQEITFAVPFTFDGTGVASWCIRLHIPLMPRIVGTTESSGSVTDM